MKDEMQTRFYIQCACVFHFVHRWQRVAAIRSRSIGEYESGYCQRSNWSYCTKEYLLPVVQPAPVIFKAENTCMTYSVHSAYEYSETKLFKCCKVNATTIIGIPKSY